MLCHLSTSIVTWPWYGEFECEGCVLCVHQTILRLVTVRTVLDIFSSLDVTIKATSSSVLLSDPPPHHPCYSVILLLIIRVTQWSSSSSSVLLSDPHPHHPCYSVILITCASSLRGYSIACSTDRPEFKCRQLFRHNTKTVTAPSALNECLSYTRIWWKRSSMSGK